MFTPTQLNTRTRVEPRNRSSERRRDFQCGETRCLKRRPTRALTGNGDEEKVLPPQPTIYDDDQWALAVLRAARQLAPADVDETEFWSVYDAQRQAQGGSLSRAVATRFLPSGDPEELSRLARSHFQVPAASMYPEQVDLARMPGARMWKRALEETEAHTPERNWAGNYTYRAEKLHRPHSLEELQEVVSKASCASRSVSTRAAPSAINGSSPTCSATPD